MSSNQSEECYPCPPGTTCAEDGTSVADICPPGAVKWITRFSLFWDVYGTFRDNRTKVATKNKSELPLRFGSADRKKDLGNYRNLLPDEMNHLIQTQYL